MKTRDYNAILLTVPVGAIKLGVRESQLRQWIKYGVIPAIKDRNTIKICRDVVEAWSDRIKKGDLPDMSAVPEQYRMEKYIPNARVIIDSFGSNPPKNSIGIKFEDFFPKSKKK